jgi:hypothetical protein
VASTKLRGRRVDHRTGDRADRIYRAHQKLLARVTAMPSALKIGTIAVDWCGRGDAVSHSTAAPMIAAPPAAIPMSSLKEPLDRVFAGRHRRE